MSFRSSKGRDVGKEVIVYQSGNIGQGIGAGGGTGGGIRFAGFNSEPATIDNNGTPVGVTTSAWTQLSYTNAAYYENESPGRYFDISIRTLDAGGGPQGSSRSGSISGTVYIEKDSRIFFRTISGGSPAGGSGAAIVNTNALEPESDRPNHTLLVAGGRGGNSPNQARGGGYAGGNRNPDQIGNEVGNGGSSTGAGGGTQTAVGNGQPGNPGPSSGSPGNVWTGGSANSGGGGRSGGGGGGWYGGGGGANNGPGGPWGGGGGGSAYYATPSVSVTNPQGLFVEIPAITDTASQTIFANGTFFEGSGFYYQHRDYPGDQAASTVYIRIAE